jgi:peptidyl-prolyl cis-trans isomerase SurA
MKKLLLIFLFTCSLFFCNGQTLFTYGSRKVDASEFLAAYNKNKTAAANDSQALRDYLYLYINFKLKVQAAKEIHLDKLPSMRADLQNFRSQIQDSYLKDEKEVNRLVDQAFLRSQKDIHTIYYLIKSANSEDSIKDDKLANQISQKINSGEADSVIISKINANVAGKIEKQDVGFITVFTLPYKFENIIYGLKPGSASKPFHTKTGWYILKNAGERHAVGKITLAQILFAVPQGNEHQKEETKNLADSVYNALLKGVDFAPLAKQYSDDRTTYMNGGKMPEFGTAKYDSVFENHAFSLQKNGAISKPFETKFGYHILQRISAEPVPAKKDDEQFMYNLKQQVLNDSRIQTAKEKFLKEIFPVINLTRKKVNQQDLWRVTDSALLSNKEIKSDSVWENTTLLSFNNNQIVRVSDWLLYVRNSDKKVDGDHASYENIFPEFINQSAISNYASRLENYKPAFKAQINEFKEGNMLFEIMQRKVWSKASSDTVGLKKYYQLHKQKYLWNSSAEAVIFSCSNIDVAKNSMTELKKGKSWKEIINENPSSIQADSGRFELGQIPVVDRTAFSPGLVTLPVVNKTDGTAVFAKIFKVFPDNQQRSFEDARGLVINDYQNYLEQKWIGQLKKKYPVKLNQQVFQSLLSKN